MATANTASDWTLEQIEDLFALPFHDLLYRAQSVHRQHFKAGEVQVSTLLSIKTGGCPEDCKYCPQSARYQTGVKADKLMDYEKIIKAAQKAKDNGASRFCMGAAWRELKDRDLQALGEVIRGVKALGLESCMTLGMLTPSQAETLAEAGLDYYNHNIDTSPEFYEKVITTRSFEERLQTLENVRQSGMKTCCGGIVGLGESVTDRAKMLLVLAQMNPPPESVPINNLVRVEGTPFDGNQAVDAFDFVRMIAVARIVLPCSYVRLSAGREAMNPQTQTLCFLAGANSVFYGEKLLTTANPQQEQDEKLFKRLDMQIMQTVQLKEAKEERPLELAEAV